MSRRAESPWLVLLLVGTVYETWALRGRRREATLSHLTRKTFRTETPSGRRAFVLAWLALSTWFVPHILDNPKESP